MLALIVVAIYMAGLIAVGIVKSRRVKGQAGFTLAGRGLGVPVLVGTLLATWTGTGSIFGNAEEAYGVGMPALILPLAAVLGILVLIAMIPQVRRRGRFTLQDVLEERFGPVARVLGTITLVLAYLVIVSYQLRAAASVLDEVMIGAGLTAESGGRLTIAAVALFVAVYTALAGLMSVAITDAFNGVLMTVGLAVALPVVWSAAGGVDAVLDQLPESGRELFGHYTSFDVMSVLLPSFLLIVGDANLHTRFLAASSASAARRAAVLLIPGILILDGIILLTAMGGRALLPDLENPGQVVLQLAMHELPTVLGAVLVASILAIIVSTADSYLLSSSSALVRDVYQRFMNKDASEATLLRAARGMVVLLTVAAFGLSFTSDRFFEIALFAYTLYGAGITPPLLAALFWPRATPAGAVASMVTATTLAILWEANGWGPVAAEWLGQPENSRVGAIIPAAAVAAIVLVVVSLMTKPRPQPTPSPAS